MTIYALHPSTLVEIFSYLDLPTIGHCARVCKRWRELTQNENLWRLFCQKLGYTKLPYTSCLWLTAAKLSALKVFSHSKIMHATIWTGVSKQFFPTKITPCAHKNWLAIYAPKEDSIQLWNWLEVCLLREFKTSIHPPLGNGYLLLNDDVLVYGRTPTNNKKSGFYFWSLNHEQATPTRYLPKHGLAQLSDTTFFVRESPALSTIKIDELLSEKRNEELSYDYTTTEADASVKAWSLTKDYLLVRNPCALYFLDTKNEKNMLVRNSYIPIKENTKRFTPYNPLYKLHKQYVYSFTENSRSVPFLFKGHLEKINILNLETIEQNDIELTALSNARDKPIESAELDYERGLMICRSGISLYITDISAPASPKDIRETILPYDIAQEAVQHSMALWENGIVVFATTGAHILRFE